MVTIATETYQTYQTFAYKADIYLQQLPLCQKIGHQYTSEDVLWCLFSNFRLHIPGIVLRK